MTESKYDRIGLGYNQTRKADPYLLGRMVDLLQLEEHKQYLDIGCGTGNYTIELAKKGFSFIGVDPSELMLETARQKYPDIKWLSGTAENIPLIPESVDGVLASLTIHHWKDLIAGFGEVARVLKPEGSILVFTSTPVQMKGYWLNHYFPKMLQDSIVQMPAYDKVAKAMEVAGLTITGTEKYFIHKELKDLFLYSGKQDPYLYLKGQVRKGISSFSNLANQQEVAKGLVKLEQDIQTGKVEKVIQHYDNDRGDCLFIIAKKKP